MNSIKPVSTSGTKCFQRSSQGFIFGISFALNEHHRVMAPYSYLSHVEMPSLGEIAFVYSFGVIRIRGENLEPIYDAAHRHEIISVACSEADENEPESVRVTEIIFKERDGDQER